MKVANAVEFVCACHQNASSYDGQWPEKYLRIWNNLALQGILVFEFVTDSVWMNRSENVHKLVQFCENKGLDVSDFFPPKRKDDSAVFKDLFWVCGCDACSRCALQFIFKICKDF